MLLVKDIMIKGKKLPKISINKTVEDAIKEINKKKLGIVVVTKNNFVKGLLSDGDCRRAIKRLKKEDKIDKFMTLKPLFVTENITASKALAIMNEHKITSLLVKADGIKKKKNEFILKGIVHIHSLLQYGLK